MDFTHKGLGFVVLMLAVVMSACGLSVDGPGQGIVTQPVSTGTSTLDSATTIIETVPPTATAVPQSTNTPVLTQIPTAIPSQTPTPTPGYFEESYPVAGISYRLPLTIRQTAADRAVLFFELESPAEGLLVYRDTGTRQQYTLPLAADENRHLLVLDDLAPGGVYEADVILEDGSGGYRKPGFDGGHWGPVRFRTVSNKQPLRIGVLGDASFGDEATEALVEVMAGQDLDFVIHTGDVVYETDPSDVFGSYAARYFNPLAPLLHYGPVYTVLGNHDYDAVVRWEGAPFYDYAFPPYSDPDFSYPTERRANQYYALAVGDIQFLMLDTHVFAGAEGRAAQDAWLEERLGDSGYQWTIPVFHVSPYSSSVVHPDDGLPVRYSWNWKFESAQVPIVFSGHFHHYERLLAGGITYIVTGGGSSTLYAQGELLPESQIYTRKTHFVLLEIHADRLELTAIDLTGEVIDHAVLQY